MNCFFDQNSYFLGKCYQTRHCLSYKCISFKRGIGHFYSNYLSEKSKPNIIPFSDAYFGWRNSTYFHMVPPLILFVLMYKLPESPYWLIQKGHFSPAKLSLQFYRGQMYDISSEFNEIRKKEQEKLEMSYHSKAFLLSRFCSKAFWKPFSCIGAIFFLQVFDGFAPMTMYLVTFMDETGSNFDPNSGPIYCSLFSIFVASIAPFISRKYPPKFLFIGCYCVYGMAMAALTVMTYLKGW